MIETLLQENQKASRNLNVVSLFIFFGALTFSKAIMGISFATALIGFIFWKRKQAFASSPCEKRITAALLTYMSLIILSCIFSENLHDSLKGLQKTMMQILIFWMTVWAFKEEKTRIKFEHFFIFLAVVTVCNGFFQYAVGRDFLRWHAPEDSGAGIRLTGSFSTYGLFASFLIITLPYLVALGMTATKSGNQKLALVCFLTSAGYVVLIFLTRSRGAILSLSAGTFLYLIMARRFRLLAMLIAGLVIFIAFLPKNIIIHLDAEGKEQSIVERVELWQRAADVIQAKPFLGTGINTYSSTHQKYDKEKNWRVRGYYAHNGYLQLAAECGVPALLTFLALIGFILKSGVNPGWTVSQVGARWGLGLGITNFLFFTGVDTVLHNPQPILTFWFILGLFLAYGVGRSDVSQAAEKLS